MEPWLLNALTVPGSFAAPGLVVVGMVVYVTSVKWSAPSMALALLVSAALGSLYRWPEREVNSSYQIVVAATPAQSERAVAVAGGTSRSPSFRHPEQRPRADQ